MENWRFYVQIHESCLKSSLQKQKTDISQSIMYGNLSFYYIAMKDRSVERRLFSWIHMTLACIQNTKYLNESKIIVLYTTVFIRHSHVAIGEAEISFLFRKVTVSILSQQTFTLSEVFHTFPPFPPPPPPQMLKLYFKISHICLILHFYNSLIITESTNLRYDLSY